MMVFFFFKQKTAYEMRISDWSSDVCSSDLSPIKMAPIKMAPIKMAARDVSVFYGAKQALNQVSIDVDMDNVTAFIRPSGCGKSTFLPTLNRMNDTIPSARVEGTITLDGEDIYDSSIAEVQLRADRKSTRIHYR